MSDTVFLLILSASVNLWLCAAWYRTARTLYEFQALARRSVLVWLHVNPTAGRTHTEHAGRN